jgi:polyribonucleotide nucleotidyltransferase
MMKCIDKPRDDYRPFVPRIKSFEIDKDFIGAVIGKGGETIQKIQAETVPSSRLTRLMARVS